MTLSFEKVLKNYWPYLIGAVLLAFLAKKKFGSVKNGLFGDSGVFGPAEEDELIVKQKANLGAVKVNTPSLNFGNSYYITWANKMDEAMQGPQIGRRFKDEDMIELGAMASNDLKQVIKEFGVRNRKAVPEWVPSWMPGEGESGTLIDWFKEELSGDERKKMQKIFSKTGHW